MCCTRACLHPCICTRLSRQTPKLQHTSLTDQRLHACAHPPAHLPACVLLDAAVLLSCRRRP